MARRDQAAAAKAKSKEKPRDKQTRLSTEFLDVRLTDQELLDHGRHMARLERDIAELDARKAEAAKDFSSKIEALKQRRTELARKIEVGLEQRAVDCEWHYDFPAGTKILIRLDTKAEVRREEISSGERQMMLPGTEAKQPEKAKEDEKPKEAEIPAEGPAPGAAAGEAPAESTVIEESGDAHNLPGDSITRTWWNSLGKKERREALNLDDESAATVTMLTQPWTKLSTSDRISIRAAHRRVSADPNRKPGENLA